MMRSGLLHPPLLAALAGAGHGSQVLIADGLYPHDTGANPAATRIHLNLRPGLVAARDVLELSRGQLFSGVGPVHAGRRRTGVRDGARVSGGARRASAP